MGISGKSDNGSMPRGKKKESKTCSNIVHWTKPGGKVNSII